jgi:hypothetical protein
MYKKRVKGYEAIGYSMQSGHENPRQQSNEYEYLHVDEVWKRIRREQANIKIVMPTMSENNEDLFETIKSGGGHDSGGEDSTLNVFEFSRDKRCNQSVTV